MNLFGKAAEAAAHKPWTTEPNEIGAFSLRHSGNVGQEILDEDGNIIAWTTDEWTAQVICKLLHENEELLRRKDN